ncbi:unnamed protein product, partial [Prorocentrum cordatum]
MAIDPSMAGAELDEVQVSAVALGAAVAERLDEEFFEGAAGGEGSRLLAALPWAFASVGKRVVDPPRARTCSIALRRLAPGGSRPPAPESLLFVLANELVARGGLQQGVATLVARQCYLRPGELSRPTCGMAHPPVGAGGRGAAATLALRPCEQGVGSKTGELAEAVMVDWSRGGFGVDDAISDVMIHGLRRSGPSADFLAGGRSIAEIRHRGRWASDSC